MRILLILETVLKAGTNPSPPPPLAPHRDLSLTWSPPYTSSTPSSALLLPISSTATLHLPNLHPPDPQCPASSTRSTARRSSSSEGQVASVRSSIRSPSSHLDLIAYRFWSCRDLARTRGGRLHRVLDRVQGRLRHCQAEGGVPFRRGSGPGGGHEGRCFCPGLLRVGRGRWEHGDRPPQYVPLLPHIGAQQRLGHAQNRVWTKIVVESGG